MSHHIVVIGSTGYLGSRLIPRLVERGHTVTAVVRPGSRAIAAQGCRVVQADPLDKASLTPHLHAGDTVVQLVGVPKPAPWKGPQFRAVDLVAGRASIDAAQAAGVDHFVYVSVAHPAPIMKDYIAVRRECEDRLRLPACVRQSSGPGISWAPAPGIATGVSPHGDDTVYA